jgi:hypothetical protein
VLSQASQVAASARVCCADSDERLTAFLVFEEITH